jgi:hypothetical protein
MARSIPATIARGVASAQGLRRAGAAGAPAVT